MKTMAVAFNRPEPGKPDSEDVLHEVAYVEAALASLGHSVVRVPCDGGLLGLGSMVQALAASGAGLVFNLIESLGGDARLHPAAAAVLDVAGLRYTGSPYDVLLLTTDKAVSKALMRSRGIPTPEWAVYPDQSADAIWSDVARGSACIAKPLWEDASIGITDASVFRGLADLKAGLARMHAAHGTLLVERFMEGREFNVSVIEGQGRQPLVLPVAEIAFTDWPEEKPRIVNYSAKWTPEAFEYNNTPRVFPHEPSLTDAVGRVAADAWRAFGLRGYARVDIRLDADGLPMVMEVNANPCISPDGGFVAAAMQAGLSPERLVGGIVDAAIGSGVAA
jgi:D-alanine-D-alanine ligase